jgi:hypothetical protein
MIYGIKQIEKQFPGFEARWTGGMVFDLSDMFVDTRDKLSAKEFSQDILKNYFDLMLPPSEKMYILTGKHYPTDLQNGMAVFTEYAANISKNKIGNMLFIKELYCVDYIPKMDIRMCNKYENIMISQGINNDGEKRTIALAQPYEDDKGLIKSVYGTESDRMIKTCGISNCISMLKECSEEAMGNIAVDIPIALFYLNIRNIKQKTSYFTKLCGHYYPKAWGREYKILSLSQTLTEHSPGPDLPPGYHVRGHFQRGHFKRKPKGVYWWNPHWRGDFSKGIVMKDYKVKASAGPTA